MFKRHRPASSSASAPPAKGGNGAVSLRLHLLRALATPLFGLIVGTGALSYWLAAHYTAQVFDRALVGVANTLAEQLRIAGPQARAAAFRKPPLPAGHAGEHHGARQQVRGIGDHGSGHVGHGKRPSST